MRNTAPNWFDVEVEALQDFFCETFGLTFDAKGAVILKAQEPPKFPGPKYLPKYPDLHKRVMAQLAETKLRRAMRPISESRDIPRDVIPF